MGAGGSVERQVGDLVSKDESLGGVKQALLENATELKAAAVKDWESKDATFKCLVGALEDACNVPADKRDRLVELFQASNATYVPVPRDTAGFDLPTHLVDLTEKLSENAHECWAEQRIAQGWVWGPERNDELKHHPCLIPYEALSDEEKSYDKITAMNTLKLLLSFGYVISPPPPSLPSQGAESAQEGLLVRDDASQTDETPLIDQAIGTGDEAVAGNPGPAEG